MVYNNSMTENEENLKAYSKSKAKAVFLAICREIETTGKEVIITDFGIPTVRMIPEPKTKKKKKSLREIFAASQGGAQELVENVFFTYDNDWEESDDKHWLREKD